MTAEEWNERFDKIAISQEKTDKELDKFLAGIVVSSAEIKEMQKKNELQFAKTDAQFAETEAQMRRTDATLERIGITLGNVTNNIGSLTEEYFFNCLIEKPVLGGVKFDKVRRNIGGVGLKSEDEFDIVMYNGESIALIECKNKAHKNDLVKLIEKKAANFKDVFPNFKDYKIYLGLASFSFYSELEDMAKENGVAILKQKGDVVEIEADNLKAY